MDPESLREHLAALQEELRLAEPADPHSADLLAQIHQDIDRLRDQGLKPAGAEHSSLPERLERIAVQFEADHPTLAQSARRLVDLLGKVGL